MQADESLVAYIATTYYNIVPILGSVKRLPGYDDRNFHLTDASNNKSYVLKIVNKDESDKELTDVIDEILDGAYQYCEAKKDVSRSHFSVPRLVMTTGAKLSTLTTVHYKCSSASDDQEDTLEKTRCNIKLSEFFDGLTVFDYINGVGSIMKQREAETELKGLYTKLGRVCNQLFVYLKTQQHLLPSLERIRAKARYPWHFKGCDKHIRQCLDHLYPEQGNVRRRLVLKVLDEFETTIKPRLSHLPEFVIHSDLGTKNMLINARNIGESTQDEPAICIIDFQDLQTGPQLVDLAFMMLYCVIEQDFLPHDRALTLLPRWIYTGYQSSNAWQIDVNELDLVPSLMRLRLCQSLLNGLMAHERDPADSYVMQTNQRGWSLLELMVDPKSVFGRADQLVSLWLLKSA